MATIDIVNLHENLKLERYKVVTERQKYFTDLARFRESARCWCVAQPLTKIRSVASIAGFEPHMSALRLLVYRVVHCIYWLTRKPEGGLRIELNDVGKTEECCGRLMTGFRMS